jgi:hypothetical protein
LEPAIRADSLIGATDDAEPDEDPEPAAAAELEELVELELPQAARDSAPTRAINTKRLRRNGIANQDISLRPLLTLLAIAN